MTTAEKIAADAKEAAAVLSHRSAPRTSRPTWSAGRSTVASKVAPPIVHEVLREPGKSLDAVTLADMSGRFSHDFSRVRVHSGPRATQSADAVAARAYTVGQHVVFNDGRYRPDTVEGRLVLAHELAHVVQQRGEAGMPGAELTIGDAHDKAEARAERAAAGLADPASGAPASPVLRRQPDAGAGAEVSGPTLPGQQSAAGKPGFTNSATTETLIGFATSSAELTPEHIAVLRRIVAELDAQPLPFGSYITIVGSADRRGQAGENGALGQRRADAVRDYLQRSVTDDNTRREIRSYSLGAPTEGPVADDPLLRKVEVTITRRGYRLGLPTPTPTLRYVPQSTLIPQSLLPPRTPGLPPTQTPQLPDWFWRELPARPPDQPLITQLSTWLNRVLNTHDIARVAADAAGAFGLDRAKVRKMLDDAFQSGGEAAVKALLRAMVQAGANALSTPPSGPPPGPPSPPGTPGQLQTPQVPLP